MTMDLDAAFLKIADAPIEYDPFPHIVVQEVFSPTDYLHLLDDLRQCTFVPATYPGAHEDVEGQGRAASRGQIVESIDARPSLGALAARLRSPDFRNLLISKFGDTSNGVRACASIPPEKLAAARGSQVGASSTFEFYRDMPGYEISPHLDTYGKVVTFQFFLVPDASLADAGGTHFLRPKLAGTKPRRRSDRPDWCFWEDFEIVRTIRAVPNVFWAFAPNDQSYHAVRLHSPGGGPIQGRTVARGFVRLGKGMGSFAKVLK